MTDEERRLLLYVARWVIEKENAEAENRGTTSDLAHEMRSLVDEVRLKASPRQSA
jgi:hypothetical protein